MPKTIKLLRSTESKINNDKNGENRLNLGITEVVLIHCDIVNNNYVQDSRVWYTFAPNKSFGQLLDISTNSLMFLKIFDSKFLYIKIWFIYQNSRPQ